MIKEKKQKKVNEKKPEMIEEKKPEMIDERKAEAFSIVSRICGLYKGNLQEHGAIQKALATLNPIRG